MNEEFEKVLNKSFEKIRSESSNFQSDIPLAITKKDLEEIVPEKSTTISEEILEKIVAGLTSVPEDFHGHPKLSKFLEKRKRLLDENEKADWAFAESIAFASLLLEGIPVRLSGQDSVRGTFSQRHLALTDIHTGKEYIPLNHLDPLQAKIEALDSLLSEAAVLGFEYGYSTADPLALVMWEAQFGDFANAAQVIIDNFIVASNEKWQVPNSIVMLLPHGYEGQGPEHSSARLERFLILCAENNIQVCNATTAAQYFHLLRRHIKSVMRIPLVIMTPKSLLRLPAAASSKKEFLTGRFYEIIDDKTLSDKDKIEVIIISSGKIFYDLMDFRMKNKFDDKPIIRLEQFYPFPAKQLMKVINSYPRLKKIVWVQEEPMNMGGWNFVSARLRTLINEKTELKYAGRPESASPSVGSSRLSVQQHKKLLKDAFSD